MPNRDVCLCYDVRSMTPLRIRIITLGCKVNQCDADEMARALAAAGYEVAARGGADAYVVNTCTVTATADAKARKLIRKLAREGGGAPVVVTGCWAQRDAEAVAAVQGVSAVVGNEGKGRIAEVVEELVGASALKCRSNAKEGGCAASHRRDACATGGSGGWRACLACPRHIGGPCRTRVFVKVQDGCDHRCAYCAVPKARGAPVSRPMVETLDELRRIADEGAQEVVLCGIRLGAYGRERGAGETLARLLSEVRALPIPRVRLSSIEPMDLDDELVAEMADHPRLCHHLHLPLQSGDDAVLAEMGRGYTSGEYRRLVERVREVWPQVALTTDVIVGFPGETAEQFERTVGFVREMGFTRLHVFPFSPRPGTAAAERRDRVPEEVRRAGAAELIGVGEELAERAAQAWVGRETQVLFEQQKRGRLTGLTEQYLRVWCEGPREWVGRIVAVRVEGTERGELVAGW